MTQCLQAVTLHVFPSQSLCRQKRYMRRYVWLTRDTSLREFLARWTQLNDFLSFFPPFGGEAQKLHEDEAVEIVYAMIPKCWQSILLTQNFDPVDHTFQELFEELECVELAEQLDPSNKSKSNDNDGASNNGSKSGKKRKNGNDANAITRKKQKTFCMLHRTNNHATDDCKVLQKRSATCVLIPILTLILKQMKTKTCKQNCSFLGMINSTKKSIFTPTLVIRSLVL